MEMTSAPKPTKPSLDKKQILIKMAIHIPYKMVIVVFAVFILSQTILYTPILWVQFSVQGSGFILAAARFLPDTEISKAAKSLYPDEFKRIELTFDNGPIKTTATTDSAMFKNAVKNVAPSVVRIAVSQCGGFRFVSGSGVAVAPNLILTNEHVATGASAIYIVDHTGTYPAAAITIDNDYDIAVLYSKFINLKPVPLSTTPIKIGSDAMTMGYPGASADLKMGIGKVSKAEVDSIQNRLDASSSFELPTGGLGPGSSGGPVINDKGEIIGINSGGSGEKLLAVMAEIATKSVESAKSSLLPVINFACQYQRSSY
jgi:S1-C subfamily serine protease